MFEFEMFGIIGADFQQVNVAKYVFIESYATREIRIDNYVI